jgi:uncharacterized protein
VTDFTYSLRALPWDLAILLLIGGGLLIVYISQFGTLPGGKTLPFIMHLGVRMRRVVGMIGVSVALMVFYGSFIEPQIITITEEEIVLPMNEEMTIVLLSDFHVGPYKGKDFVRRVVERVQDIDPDLVLLLGDFVYLESDPIDALTPLSHIQPRYGIFSVLGNHEYSCYWGNVMTRKYITGFDHSLRVRRALERIGATVLVNNWTEVATESGSLFLAGLDDMCTGRADLHKALPKHNRKAPIILLSHDPSVILDNLATYPHLIVSGHTHGGQIRLPFLGPLSPLPTQLGRSYDQGLFAVDKNTTLAITRGLGESGARARLFAPPEIMILRSRQK